MKMATMKSRHILLFILACATLIAADFPGGSLLAVFAWLQVNTLMTQKSFNKSSQTWAAKLFLISIPFLLFWGSIHTFLFIYMKEQNWLFFVMTIALNICLTSIAAIYFIFTFKVAHESNFKLISSLGAAWQACKKNKVEFFKCSAFVFILSLVPLFSAEWKIVFAIMATHSYLNRVHLQRVFASGF